MEINMYLYSELSVEEQYRVKLKIATRKYEIIDAGIKVNINNGKRKDVLIKEEDKTDYCRGIFLYGNQYMKI